MSKAEERVYGSGEDLQEKRGAVKKDSKWAIFGRVLKAGNKANINSPQNESNEAQSEEKKVDLSHKKSGRLTLPRQLKKLEENLFSRDSNTIERTNQKNEANRPQTVGTGRFSRFFKFGRKETKTDASKEGMPLGGCTSCEDTTILAARAETRELLDPEERMSSEVDSTRNAVVAADSS